MKTPSLRESCQPLADVSNPNIQVNKIALIKLAISPWPAVCPLQGLVEHAQKAGYSVVLFWNYGYSLRFGDNTQLQDKLLIPVLNVQNVQYSTYYSYVDIDDVDVLATDRTNVEIAIIPQPAEELKKMQQYLRRLHYWFLLGPFTTLEWLRGKEKLCCMSGGQQAEGGRVPEETTVESGVTAQKLIIRRLRESIKLEAKHNRYFSS